MPVSSLIDHTEHDTQILVTEQGLADLRGLPRSHERAGSSTAARTRVIATGSATISIGRSSENPKGRHTPHLLGEALSWHEKFQANGHM